MNLKVCTADGIEKAFLVGAHFLCVVFFLFVCLGWEVVMWRANLIVTLESFVVERE